MDEVSVLPWPIYVPPIHRGTSDMGVSQGDMKWFWLLSSADAGSVDSGTMARRLSGQGLDHWRGVIWDPGQAYMFVMIASVWWLCSER